MRTWIGFLLCIVALLGCERKAIVSGVDEKQSIEITVSLQDAGISAEREQTSTGREQKFSVFVGSSDVPQALKLLKEYGLPRSVEPDLDNISQSSSLIPPSRQFMDFRLDYVLAVQVERLLSDLPGVVDARVIVRSHLQENEALRTPAPASATVVVRYVPQSGHSGINEQQIQDIVVKSIPGIVASNVQVTMTPLSVGLNTLIGNPLAPTAQLTPFSFHVSPNETKSAKLEVFLILLISSVSAIIIGIFIGWRFHAASVERKRKRSARRETTMLSSSYLLDNAVRSNTPQRPGDVSGRSGIQK